MRNNNTPHIARGFYGLGAALAVFAAGAALSARALPYPEEQGVARFRAGAHCAEGRTLEA